MKKHIPAIISTLSLAVSATPSVPWNNVSLQSMAAALGALLILIMGIRWIMADSAQERQEAKRGILYVVIGLLIVYSVDQIIQTLYCSNLPPGTC